MLEAQTGKAVGRREIFNESRQERLAVQGAEKSGYGGIAVVSTEPTEKGQERRNSQRPRSSSNGNHSTISFCFRISEKAPNHQNEACKIGELER
jgi:hypothetical protein